MMDKEFKKEWQMVEYNERCQCGDPELMGGPLHSCPFNEDVHNDDAPSCTCCDACQHECAMDI